jgi:prepilin-type N-terminal cleavage/methylation domain-containing protein
MGSGSDRARGVTLVELIVALALLGLILGISGMALTSLRPSPGSERVRVLATARSRAIRTGQQVRVSVDSPVTGSGIPRHSTLVVFLPDGRAIGPSVDPLTGASSDSAH